MKTIIAATDFTDQAQHAVEYASDVAKNIQAKLIIFNAVNIGPVWSDYPASQELYEAAVNASKDALRDIKEKIEKRVGDTIRIEVIERTGMFRNQLEEICMKEKPFAIFIASHLTSTLEQILIGSHAVKFSRHSYFPVIIVPSMANFISFQKISLAVDLNAPVEFPFRLLKKWTAFFKANLDIVYIATQAGMSANDLPTALDIQLKLSKIDPHFSLIENEEFVDGIIEYCEVNNPDLLVLFPKKSTWFHQSKSNSLILQPPVPLMIWSHKIKDN